MHTSGLVRSSSESFRESVQPLVRETAMRGAPVSAARSVAAAGYRDIRRMLARAGVVAFSVSLVVPALAHGAARIDAAATGVLVASSMESSLEISPAAQELIALPNAREPRPTLAPTPAPTLGAVPVAAGGADALVTASWYGPGFYGNRLPCWQWLQASGKPIAFEADTWGVANKTLPCGTMLVLTHGPNTVTVPVVDRGPYVAGRELDLSPAVKAALGCTDICTLLMRIP